MIRIGIPNRSSVLHTAGITALIKSKLLDLEDYNPAKLFYKKNDYSITLIRCDQLCELLLKNELDIIFTGGDYYEEICSSELKSYNWPIIKCHYALLGNNTSKKQSIYTKFPNTAKEYLSKSDFKELSIQKVSGSCESYVLAFNQLSFDIICTGGTVENNRINILNRYNEFVPVWSTKNDLSHYILDKIKTIISDKETAEKLEAFYVDYFDNKSISTLSIINDLIEKTMANNV